MLFNIEVDSGEQVTGYIVPDGYSGVPVVRVCCLGQELHRFPANEIREALVHAGRHETGQCGFRIDSNLLPGLADLAGLEIYDGETDLLVYRRPKPDRILKKILRIETHLFPLWGLDHSIASKFQYFAKGIENLGRESVTQLFLLNQADSVYLSGRLLYKNYAYFIEAAFQTLIVLQDPYEELAERLLVLSKIRKVGTSCLGLREAVAFEPAIAFAEALPMQDEKALRRALRQMTKEVASLLSNPLVRQLTAATPDEMPSGAAVAAALDILANSALVGVRHAPAKFLQGFAEFLQIDPATCPQLPRFAPVTPLAQLLKSSGEMDAILEKDCELYHYVETAFNKAT
jgi:hypothetical protein